MRRSLDTYKNGLDSETYQKSHAHREAEHTVAHAAAAAVGGDELLLNAGDFTSR